MVRKYILQPLQDSVSKGLRWHTTVRVKKNGVIGSACPRKKKKRFLKKMVHACVFNLFVCSIDFFFISIFSLSELTPKSCYKCFFFFRSTLPRANLPAAGEECRETRIWKEAWMRIGGKM